MDNLFYKIPIVRSALRNWDFFIFKRNWRKQNKHNSTVAMNCFPLDCVKVGEATYGELHVLSYQPEQEFLSIGSYVSIAPNVHFILSGNHQTNTLFTYPLCSILSGNHSDRDTNSKGSIIVEDEVWIGYGAIILSGVTIGKGSIIAAGAIVVRDVPPYAIVGGNPARFIRYRMPEKVIPVVSDIFLKKFTEEEKKKNLDLFYTPIHSQEDGEILKMKLIYEDK